MPRGGASGGRRKKGVERDTPGDEKTKVRNKADPKTTYPKRKGMELSECASSVWDSCKGYRFPVLLPLISFMFSVNLS